MGYFYVLQSLKNPKWFYKGSTPNLRKRIEQHKQGSVRSTKAYLPLKLIYYEAYTNLAAARLRESSVKRSGSVWTPLMKRLRASIEK